MCYIICLVTMPEAQTKLFDGIGKSEFKTDYDISGEMIIISFLGVIDISDGLQAYLFEEELAELIKKYTKESLRLKCIYDKRK